MIEKHKFNDGRFTFWLLYKFWADDDEFIVILQKMQIAMSPASLEQPKELIFIDLRWHLQKNKKELKFSSEI